MGWPHRHLLDVDQLTRGELERCLDLAVEMRERRKLREPLDQLRGELVGLAFAEASTRTRVSFELAATALGAHVVDLPIGASSVTKGESLVDTLRTLQRTGIGTIVLRHAMSGAPYLAARESGARIVNAGDGTHAHPTQALLDALTLREALGSLEGRKIAIVGDIGRSRVARSNMHSLAMLGASVWLAGPPTWVAGFEGWPGVTVAANLEDALANADAVMALRIQLERDAGGRSSIAARVHRGLGPGRGAHVVGASGRAAAAPRPDERGRGDHRGPRRQRAQPDRDPGRQRRPGADGRPLAPRQMSRFGSLDDPPATLLLSGVRIVDPSSGRDGLGDLAISAGLLVEAGSLPADADRIDGRGLVAAPGFCDLHTHLREPGLERAETIASGARAAARGGFTTICAMPNTDPPLDRPETVRWVLDRARGAACRVRVVASATHARGGERMTDLVALADEGIVGVSDDGAPVASELLARDLLRLLNAYGLPLIEHAEDATLAAVAVMRAGPTATRLGLAGWPPSAELAIVERDITLAEETGGWIHLTHISTAAALAAIRTAKGRGVRVTCDVTPHHLAMTDAWVAGDRRFSWEEPGAAPLDELLAYDGACRVNPPLPSRADAIALLAGVADGTVDAIATDHAPHPRERKSVEFGVAAPGMIGLETALSLGMVAVAAGCLELPRLLAVLSTAPAALIGEARSLEPGGRADLVVFDPAGRWRVEASELASASSNTPLLGMELPGVVRLTIADGRVTYRGGPGAGA